MDRAQSGAWLDEVRARVDTRLRGFFESERRRALEVAAEAVELTDAVAALTLRGGKRLRPALLWASVRAIDPARSLDEVLDAAVALELLQSYLLIHDDWMDADEQRRGGPAVHAALRDAHGEDAHLGASLAILAGNLASAQAWELFHSALRREPDTDRRDAAARVFLDIHQEVVLGQHLDLLHSDDVSRVHQLKTGSYTVRGPVRLGAVLTGAAPEQRQALEAYASPLGEAFQIRDDLLSSFGDTTALGKPTGSDLRANKRTALIRAAEQRASEAQLRELRAILARGARAQADLQRARQILLACGAKEAVEARLVELRDRAARALQGAPLAPEGTAMLSELQERLTVRDR